MGDEKLPPNWREGFDLHMAHLHRDCPMLIAVVAEVERLRARNEALEKVAKAAKEFRAAYQDYIDADDAELPDTGPTLDDALYALAEPGKGGAT